MNAEGAREYTCGCCGRLLFGKHFWGIDHDHDHDPEETVQLLPICPKCAEEIN